MIGRLLDNTTIIAAAGADACASTNMEAPICLKKSSFHEPLRDIEQRHWWSSGNDISFISGRQAQVDLPCGNAPTIN
jgi:hypothetical protein